jgi:hypothetical protein
MRSCTLVSALRASSWQALRDVVVIYLLASSQVHAVSSYPTRLGKNQKAYSKHTFMQSIFDALINTNKNNLILLVVIVIVVSYDVIHYLLFVKKLEERSKLSLCRINHVLKT